MPSPIPYPISYLIAYPILAVDLDLDLDLDADGHGQGHQITMPRQRSLHIPAYPIQPHHVVVIFIMAHA
jgi:hypothetical protein